MISRQPFIPANKDELLEVLGKCEKFRLVAGGTDYMVSHGKTRLPDFDLIDLSGISEFKGINSFHDQLRVGALETMSAVAGSPDLQAHAACLCDAASKVGSWQIRSRATLGGNLANCSPAADTPAALAALEAKVKLISPTGERILPVEDIPLGPNRSALKPEEIVSEFHLPVKPGRVSAFVKLGSRSEVSIARLNLAVSVLTDGRNISEARVFMGTLGLATLRCPKAETIISEQGFESDEGFGNALGEAIGEAIAGRGTMTYKQSAAKALAQDLLAIMRCRSAAGGN